MDERNPRDDERPESTIDEDVVGTGDDEGEFEDLEEADDIIDDEEDSEE